MTKESKQTNTWFIEYVSCQNNYFWNYNSFIRCENCEYISYCNFSAFKSIQYSHIQALCNIFGPAILDKINSPPISMMPKWCIFAPSCLHHCFRGDGGELFHFILSRIVALSPRKVVFDLNCLFI